MDFSETFIAVKFFLFNRVWHQFSYKQEGNFKSKFLAECKCDQARGFGAILCLQFESKIIISPTVLNFVQLTFKKGTRKFRVALRLGGTWF